MAEDLAGARRRHPEAPPRLGPASDAFAACFGRHTKARLDLIGEILDTHRSLGKL